VLIALASHNDDIKRLLDKGFALRIDNNHLVVRDIPYLDADGALCWGALVAKLVFVDKVRVNQDRHVVYFAGSMPHGLDGKQIPNLGQCGVAIRLEKPDVKVSFQFSNKPTGGFANHFDKIEHYVALISGPAIARHGADPLTFNVDPDVVEDSVFKFNDTLTTRAEIGDLSDLLRNDVVAVIGLGGTGAYVLDFLAKTPVKEIRGFDADKYYVHNAFRSPGGLAEDELGKSKSSVYAGRYEDFRHGLSLKEAHIDSSTRSELDGVTFAFVCVDTGPSRKEIFELLIELGIPFIDVGMGLDRKRGPLNGMLRTTLYEADMAEDIRAKGFAELAGHPDDEYRVQVQIGELNALNAALAIIRYKQLRGFYVDDNASCNLLMDVGQLKVFSEGPND
jgi:Domain of unknown function (DUF6791)/ThiF family